MGYSYSRIPSEVLLAGKIDPNINLTSVAGDKAFETSTYFTTQFQELAGYIVLDAYLDCIIGWIQNSSGGVLWADGAQSIQVRSHTSGTWTDGIYIETAAFMVPASSYVSGEKLIGQNNIASEVQVAIDNSTYLEVQWKDAKATGNQIALFNLQPLVRVRII